MRDLMKNLRAPFSDGSPPSSAVLGVASLSPESLFVFLESVIRSNDDNAEASNKRSMKESLTAVSPKLRSGVTGLMVGLVRLCRR